MPDRVYLHSIDPELLPGARNAIDTCLRLKQRERITIITDTFTRGIAAALQSEVERVGSTYSLFVLDHHARRPLSYMPEIILDDLALSQVSIFAAQGQRKILRWRDDNRLIMSGGEQPRTPARNRDKVLVQRTGQMMYELSRFYPAISGLMPEYGWEMPIATTADGAMYA